MKRIKKFCIIFKWSEKKRKLFHSFAFALTSPRSDWMKLFRDEIELKRYENWLKGMNETCRCCNAVSSLSMSSLITEWNRICKGKNCEAFHRHSLKDFRHVPSTLHQFSCLLRFPTSFFFFLGQLHAKKSFLFVLTGSLKWRNVHKLRSWWVKGKF